MTPEEWAASAFKACIHNPLYACEKCLNEAFRSAVAEERERCAQVVQWFRDRAQVWGHDAEELADWEQCKAAIENGMIADGIQMKSP